MTNLSISSFNLADDDREIIEGFAKEIAQANGRQNNGSEALRRIIREWANLRKAARETPAPQGKE